MSEQREIEVDPVVYADLRSGLGLHVHDSRRLTVKEEDPPADDGFSSPDAIVIGDVRIKKSYEPHNVECEAALLGALMIDNRLLDHVTGLQAEHFVVAVHAEIFTAIKGRVAQGKTANPVTLKPMFEAHEGLKEAGGAAYLAQLTGSGAAIIGARDFAEQVTDLSTLRNLRAALREAIVRSSGAEDVRPETVVADLETTLTELLPNPPIKSTVQFVEAFDQLANETEAVMAGQEPAGFVIERFRDWNAVVGRMEPQDFILLGARPSMGKTGAGMEVALGAAQAGHATDFLSLEMDRRKATRRAIASLIYDPPTSPTYAELTAGRVSHAQFQDMMRARDEIQSLPLTISDPPSMAIEDLAPHIRKRKREFEKRGLQLKLVVADYLGRFDVRKRIQGETELMSYISRLVKAAAKETDVVIVGLAQLSRAVEQRDNKRPMLSDLRQSGSLEQDADTVAFLYREEYYLERTEPPKDKHEKWQKWADELNRVRDVMEIYTSKKREGPLVKRMSRFFTHYQAVRDHDDPCVTGAPSFFDDEPPPF